MARVLAAFNSHAAISSMWFAVEINLLSSARNASAREQRRGLHAQMADLMLYAARRNARSRRQRHSPASKFRYLAHYANRKFMEIACRFW